MCDDAKNPDTIADSDFSTRKEKQSVIYSSVAASFKRRNFVLAILIINLDRGHTLL